MNDEAKIAVFQKLVIDFWQDCGRKNLPWRLTTDPWRILLAEILLRKTTSNQAIGVYEKLSAFSPEQITCMDLHQLENMLKPLGMHRVRAKQIQLVSSAVVNSGVDSLSDPDFLNQLPGIGKYIRNAVLCFAFGYPKPALDTNMIRVLRRVFGAASKRSRAREDPQLWLFAEAVVPHEHSREFNWGILDLAALVCKSRSPKCTECPLVEICTFYAEVKNATPDGR